jgi:phytoene dehydrogenase-like protein
MRTVDAVVIGSGHNGLTAAAYLARAGWEVEVLERNGAVGGALASDHLTLPGYLHDTWASWHPLFRASRTWAELGPELEPRGVAYVDGEIAGASVLPDGEAVIAHHDVRETADGLPSADRAAYVAELQRFARYAPHIGAVLATELRSRDGAAATAGLLRAVGAGAGARIAHGLLTSGRSWLERHFSAPAVPALAAPWLLHAGLTPDSPGGGLQLPVMLSSKHRAGSPIVRGGARRLVEAFERLITDHGGRVRTGTAVEQIVVRAGRATGVRTAGEEILARRAVIASVTPTQLYLSLLPAGAAPRRAVTQARRYRFGPGCMMIHLALREPLRWRESRLDRAPLVHVTDGIDGVARACSEVRAGMLPARPTVAVGQHTVLDPSRAPAGGGVLWLQLLETPYAPRGDAAGVLDVSGERWTDELKDAYRERVLALVGAHVHNLDAVIAHRVLAPPDLEAANPNLVQGDPYAGATDLRQSLILRPLPAYGSHRTPVPGLWHIGASTFPGPGLNAASGRLVARQLLTSS